MSNPCKGTFEYPSYECYNKIKYHFVERIKERSYVIISRVSDFAKKYPVDKLEKLNTLSDVFTNLQKYLSNGAVFASPDIYNGEGTCKYISYLLCDGILKKKRECDEHTFNYFKDFVYDYNIKTNSHKCSNKLKYLDDHEYKKMKALYQLYELYDKLKLTYLQEDYRCTTFGQIIANYNDALKKYDNQSDKDYDLIKKLLDLKELTVNTKLPSYEKCQYREYELLKPELYLKRLEEIETKKRQDELQKQQQQELQRLKEQKEHEEALQRQKEQQRGKLDTNELLSNGENVLSAALTHQIETEQSFGAESARGEGYRVMQEYTRPSSFYSERLRTQKEQLEQPEGGYPEFKDKNMDTSTTSGIRGAIKDTFTTIVENVEPAPILGVSGGMGAFLLQLDPSLEEEEDESVKFLIVLEDFHQENSQFFKNMILGILDMVQ
ncbi:unnamed protein product [Plasmodium vivax]|uniref:(malaria parasite P. vivax) hypothetical protein n=1 Tax=Plasmodium vivax TaxID=5855 RepID=A0A8S4H8X6_PLAVI|nr:unnamed protein product [Plasmodium vivax]